jgi:enterobactin synthetase component D
MLAGIGADVLERDIARLLAARLGGEWALAVELVSTESGLVGTEADAVRRAWPLRRREFCAGRRAARRALCSLGGPQVAIPSGSLGAPDWPDGYSGSISHDGGLAIALVQRAHPDRPACAIDLVANPADPAFLEVAPSFLLPEDRLDMSASPDAFARLFSAKEAAIKLLSPLLQSHVGFHDLRARASDGGFRLRHLPSRRDIGVSILEPCGTIVALARAGARA